VRFADIAHFFEWCRLTEKQWRARIASSAKGKRAADSLARWHAENPDEPALPAETLGRITKERRVISLAAVRTERARRQAAMARTRTTGVVA
jgi:hypothetical protein